MGVRIYSLPGWHGSSLTHWQTLWERRHGLCRVEQDDWQWPRRGDWMMRLEETLLADPAVSVAQPAVLVAHSLGCHLVAAWAAHTRHAGLVRAALLVAPPDLDGMARPAEQGGWAGGDFPPQMATWRPVVRQRLPFRSLVVGSSNDVYASPEGAARLAADWGAQWLQLGALGHLNGQSGLGDWPDGWAMLQQLIDEPRDERAEPPQPTRT